MISFYSEDIAFLEFDKDEISNWVNLTVTNENKLLGDLSYIFCSDKYILNINKKYLHHDYYTDIISFDYTDKEIICGDIYISIERVRENAKKYFVSFEKELLRVIIHGVLHFLGYNDKAKKDKILMTLKEDECLKLYGYVE